MGEAVGQHIVDIRRLNLGRNLELNVSSGSYFALGLESKGIDYWVISIGEVFSNSSERLNRAQYKQVGSDLVRPFIYFTACHGLQRECSLSEVNVVVRVCERIHLEGECSSSCKVSSYEVCYHNLIVSAVTIASICRIHSGA